MRSSSSVTPLEKATPPEWYLITHRTCRTVFTSALESPTVSVQEGTHKDTPTSPAENADIVPRSSVSANRTEQSTVLTASTVSHLPTLSKLTVRLIGGPGSFAFLTSFQILHVSQQRSPMIKAVAI